MNCSCISHDGFQLTVMEVSPQSFLAIDISEWVVQDGFTIPDFYPVTVKTPDGRDIPINIGVVTGTLVREPLKDGVYIFTADICGVVYKQYDFLLPNVQCCIDRAYITEPKHRDKLEEIILEVKALRSIARAGAFEEAEKLFKIIKTRLDAIKCDCNCR